MSANNPEIVTNTAGSAPVAAISALAAHEGERVTLRGWLYNIRSSGKLLFPTFRDGTGTVSYTHLDVYKRQFPLGELALPKSSPR